MGAGAALSLAEKQFPGVVSAPAFDAGHPDPGITMTRMLSPTAEQVRTRGGKRLVLVAQGMPLAVGGPGGLAPMDLSLKDTGSGFRPSHAMTPVRIGKHVQDGMSFDRAGFSVRMESPGSAAAVITPAGAFFAGVGPDTDMQVNAVPHGLESFLQLRSPASPERFVLKFTLPPGGRLVAATTDHPIPNDPPRAVEIQKADGTPAGYAYPPSTTDADGNPVPSSMHIAGSSVVIEVTHRGRDLHFPLMVDPTISEYGNFQIGFPGLNWRQAVAAGDSYFGQATNNCAYYCGLYESMPTNSTFHTYDYAEYVYNTPPNVFVTANTIYGWSHNIYYSYAYTGLLHAYASSAGGYPAWQNGTAGFSLQNQVNTVFNDNPFSAQYGFNGGTATGCFNPRCDLSQGEDLGSPVIGLGVYTPSGYPGYPLYTGPNTGSVTADGVGTYLGDRHPPNLTSPQPASAATWVDDGGQTHQLTTTAHDDGLGLGNITLHGVSGGTVTNVPASSVATGPGYIIGNSPCNGAPASSPCPNDATAQFAYTLYEGQDQLSLTTNDVAGNQAPPQYWTQLIDRSPPTAGSVSGPLADHANHWIAAGAYPIQATAGDQFSGVTDFTVKVDNNVAYQDNVACPAGGCSRTLNWTYNTPSDSAWHTIEIDATDAVGHDTPGLANHTTVLTRFQVAADHAPPTITGVTHQGLPTGWTDDLDAPIQSTVTAHDTESGVQSATLQGPGLPDMTQTFSQCDGSLGNPCSTDGVSTFTYSTTAPDGSYQVPEGDNTLSATVTDATGQTSPPASWHLRIDRTPPSIALSGSLYDNQGQTLASGTTYTLNVNATDGDASQPATARSGVAVVRTLVDGDEIDNHQQDCPAGSCPMSRTVTFSPADYAYGKHTIEIVATDGLGHDSVQDFTVSTGPCCSQGATSWGSGYDTLTHDLAYGDVSGDGSVDIVSRNKLTGEIDVGVSDGTKSFGSPTKWGSWPTNVPANVDLRVADVNGDGFADLVGRDPSTGAIYVALSDGSSFAAPIQWGSIGSQDDYYFANASGNDAQGCGSDHA